MTPAPRVSPLSEQDQHRVTADVIAQLKAAGLGQPPEPSSLKFQVLQWLVGLVLVTLVAYFTAQQATLAQIDSVKSTENGHYEELKATEQSHFGEVLRRFNTMQTDLRELRTRP